MHLTRRHFLKVSGALGVYLGITPFNVFGEDPPAGAEIKPVAKSKTLVLVFMRGGVDGLNLVVPWKDPNYQKIRKAIAIPPPAKEGAGRTLDLDGFFGLHPRMASLLPFFKDGTAAALHAVGHDRNTRSHFEEQDVWETGVTGNTINSDGWVNRHLLTSTGHGPIRAVAIGDALPRIMHGKCCAYAVHGVDDLSLPDTKTDRAVVGAALEHAYKKDAKGKSGDARDLLADTGQATLAGIDQLKGLVGKPYEPKTKYPQTEIARQLMQAARLIKADVGLEVVEVDYGGWDTHQFQGGPDGPYADLAQGLAESLAAFMTDLSDRAKDVVVLTLSDFGRTAAENGTLGTDHGWGNCLLALGASLKREGRKAVLGNWPGLAPDQLHEQRDLLHTTDFRDVIAEVVRVHLGNEALAKVLPEHEFKGVGLMG
ncbi:MAG: DUF1501 domain-containing protein [Planctomycetes bacterium]|nr:DUF1501 domain-containing protein [Planctomycetota bacterium]